MRQSVGILLERLMQYADDKQAPFAASGGFGEFLKNIDIGAVLCGRFGQLAHFVNEEDQTTMCLGPNRRGLRERGNEIAIVASTARGTRDDTGDLDGVTDYGDGRIPSTDHGDYPPSLCSGRQSV